MHFKALLPLTAAFLATFSSPASAIVQGAVFNRFISIWLENTDFKKAAANTDLKALAAKGLTLTNYFAVTHPSEPNYVASVCGDYFGLNSDNTINVPSNVTTVVDLLEEKGITWAEYQEDMPSTGFTGATFNNPKTGDSDYVRKHNPLISFTSVNTNSTRLSHIKNFVSFQSDLAANALPQWIFITPNMTNDGHDTSVTTAGAWSNNFLTPLLSNPNFNDDKTLILLTFDETGSSSVSNNVFTIVLGGALPASLIGATDSNFYTHYSALSTVEANWNLHTLGRYDVGANVLSFVAGVTGDTIRTTTSSITLNSGYPGIFSSSKYAQQPVPNSNLLVNGRMVLPSIVSEWSSQVECSVYSGQLVPPSASNPPILPSGC